jgi:hypothetical protein
MMVYARFKSANLADLEIDVSAQSRDSASAPLRQAPAPRFLQLVGQVGSLPIAQSPGPCLVELIRKRSEINHRGFQIFVSQMSLHTNNVFAHFCDQMNRAAVAETMRMLFFRSNLGPPAILFHQCEDLESGEGTTLPRRK